MALKKIFIACPARTYTGGPTALFQLCHTLNMLGINASIAFYNLKTGQDPVHDNYKRFKCTWTSIYKIDDSKDNVLIVSEITTKVLPKFQKIRKIIYWLAVDNYVYTIYRPKNVKFKIFWFIFKNYKLHMFNRIPFSYYLNAFRAFYVYELIKTSRVKIPSADLHVVQSNYAKVFLLRHGINENNIVFIHEPIEEDFLNMAKTINLNHKRAIIAWNARKAYPVAFKLIRLLRRKFKIFDLVNVGRKNMIKILTLSKVFIDIGLHPGRDRPIREAIALSNVPLVNNHGGYYLKEDCPVPDEYKIECYLGHTCRINLKELYNKVVQIINDFDTHLEKINEVRKYVFTEPQIFKKDAELLINKLYKL